MRISFRRRTRNCKSGHFELSGCQLIRTPLQVRNITDLQPHEMLKLEAPRVTSFRWRARNDNDSVSLDISNFLATKRLQLIRTPLQVRDITDLLLLLLLLLRFFEPRVE